LDDSQHFVVLRDLNILEEHIASIFMDKEEAKLNLLSASYDLFFGLLGDPKCGGCMCHPKRGLSSRMTLHLRRRYLSSTDLVSESPE
jgi:hypothetical protein